MPAYIHLNPVNAPIAQDIYPTFPINPRLSPVAPNGNFYYTKFLCSIQMSEPPFSKL